MTDRITALLAQAKPCPRCGNYDIQIDLGLSDHPFPEGQEFFSCITVFTVAGETHSCGSYAQGLSAWNWQPAHDRKTAGNWELDAQALDVVDSAVARICEASGYAT